MKKLFLSTILLSALTYTSCTKDSMGDGDSTQYTAESTLTTDEINTNLNIDNAIDDIAVIANDRFEAYIGASTTPTPPATSTTYASILPTCAVSTFIDTAVTSGTTTTTTRTITTTFGTATAPCVFRGHSLSGQVILNYNYTTKIMAVTLNNFSVNSNSVEGTATWTRATIAATPTVPAHPKNTFTVTNVKYTTSTGVYLRNGWTTKEMTSGFSTRTNLNDDINLTDVAYVTLSPSSYLLSSFTIKVLNTPLVHKTSCNLAATPITSAGSGTLFITKGSNNAIIKYGTDDCDNSSRLAINLKLNDHFSIPAQYGSSLTYLLPVTTPPTTPPTYEELVAKFDAKFDAIAVPFTLPN